MARGIGILHNDLFLELAEYLMPQEIVDLACTCRDVHTALLEMMQARQEYFRTHLIYNDWQPMTVLGALRSVLAKDETAEYINEFRWRTIRTHWDDWMAVDPKGQDWDSSCGTSFDESVFEPGELDQFRNSLGNTIGYDRRDTETIVRDSINDGVDDWLKVILLVLAPRIKTFQFLANEGRGPNMDNENYAPLEHFWDAVHTISKRSPTVWPAGLAGLETIRIDISGTLMQYDAQQLLQMLRLPKLKRLDLSLSHYRQDYRWPDVTLITPDTHSSSLEILHVNRNCAPEDLWDLIRAPRHLRTLAFTSSKPAGGSTAMSAIEEFQGDAIETLNIVCPYNQRLEILPRTPHLSRVLWQQQVRRLTSLRVLHNFPAFRVSKHFVLGEASFDKSYDVQDVYLGVVDLAEWFPMSLREISLRHNYASKNPLLKETFALAADTPFLRALARRVLDFKANGSDLRKIHLGGHFNRSKIAAEMKLLNAAGVKLMQ